MRLGAAGVALESLGAASSRVGVRGWLQVASKNENHHANLLHPVFRMRIRRKKWPTVRLLGTNTILTQKLLF